MSTITNRIRIDARSGHCPFEGGQPPRGQSLQLLTLFLEGITAADYLAWVRDPEPQALERDLKCVAVRAEPLGDRIELELVWDRKPPAPQVAALAAGFPLLPEMAEL